MMITQTIGYSAMTTKIRAMLQGKLSAAEYDQLIQLSSVPEVASYLKQNTRYHQVLKDVNEAYIHRGQLESLLRELLAEDLAAFYPFMNNSQKFFMNVFPVRDEIENIKLFLRLLYSRHPERFRPQKAYARGYKTSFDMKKLEEVTSFSEFAEVLRHTPYYPMIATFLQDTERQNLFDLEISLDMYYTKLVYEYMKKYLDKISRRIIQKSFGAETDISNLLFILRAKKYYDFTPDRIYPYVIREGDRITPRQMSEIVDSETYEDAIALIEQTHYRGVFDPNERFMEKGTREYLLNLHLRAFKNNPYSIAAPLCYIHIKETEIRNIVSIIEGIRYGLPPEQIKEKLVGYR